MREYLRNEIKIVEWNIKETRAGIDNLEDKVVWSIMKGRFDDVEKYRKRIFNARNYLDKQIHRLNDLKREWRYLDLQDDYCIHRETLDELAGMPRVSEAILILYH